MRYSLRTLLIVITMAGFVVLYFLSLGPAAWLVKQGHIPGHAFDTYSAPVDELGKRSPAVKGLWYWYLDFWIPTDPDEIQRELNETRQWLEAATTAQPDPTPGEVVGQD